MTAKDRRTLANYVRTLADLMGLKDWHFSIGIEEKLDTGVVDGDEKARSAPIGNCFPYPGRKFAEIDFHPRVREEDLNEIRDTVVHELLHCHLGHLREIPRMGLTTTMGQTSHDIFMQGFDLEWEKVIDGISWAWSKKLPTIKWEKNEPAVQAKRANKGRAKGA